MNATTNKQATSATSANLPINVVTNNAKAQAKEQAKSQSRSRSPCATTRRPKMAQTSRRARASQSRSQ